MKISLNVVDFLLSALALQGLILSILLLFSAKKIKSNRWISLFIFAVSMMIFNTELDLSGIWKSHLWILNFIVPFNLSLGPLIYFYSRSLIFEDKTITRKSYFHFLPALIDLKRQIIFLFYFTGTLSIPAVQKFYFLAKTQRILLSPNLYQVLPGFISCLVYCGLTYLTVNAQLGNKELSVYKLADLKWLKKLMQSLFVLLAIWLFTIIIDFAPGSVPVYSWTRYLLGLPAVVFVYWLGMATYLRQNKMEQKDVEVYNKKIAKVYFKDSEADYYRQKLNHLMQNEKLYLNPLLKLEAIASKLGIPERLISNLLNQHLDINFNDFVNGYRIEEAKKKLSDPAHSAFTISAIAFDCGFNSLATFQRAFKQFAGITPSQYQNNLKTPSLAINTTQIRI
ncbi:helix-turn-helix domain-containing protein [uncultured Mucilaginibacter sp.]|uniref:helix-turn-helix domain-containing protein n=1 Tax=uncultured Mucilaginibacter sp. TaxID=797541 RepID=UPI00262984CB|nr:helix-turn-helix domain-containing protein [uncultured Mucilaginibacter sp.]